MSQPTIEELMSQVANKFVLVNLVAKRAKQITQGVETFVEKADHKAVELALEEIAKGYVGYDLQLAEVVAEDQNIVDEIRALDTDDDADIITEEQA